MSGCMQSFAPRLTSKKSNAGGASSNLSESIQSVHRIAYHVIESEGCFAVSSIVAPRFCRHMLIKFLDAQVRRATQSTNSLL